MTEQFQRMDSEQREEMRRYKRPLMMMAEEEDDDNNRAATGIGNTDFLSITDFFAQKGGKPNISRYFSWYFYR